MGYMSQRSIRFPPDLEVAVSAIAEKQERSFSFIVLKAVERYVALHLQDLPPDVFDAARRESKARTSGTTVEADSSREKSYACPKPGCFYVASEPGVCVHHRTERLR